MIKRLWSCLFILLMLSGCGYNGTPNRQNDFTPLTSIQIVPVSESIVISKTIAPHTSTRLSVIGNFSGLFTRDVTDQVTWSGDSPNVADFLTASQQNRVTARSPGTAILTATIGTVTANFTLKVSSATITSITVTPAAPSIPKGLTQQFTATGTFSDSTTQDITFDSTWNSDQPGIVTIGNTSSDKGFAQALTVGSAIITASLDGVPGSTVLTVTEPALLSIAVRPVDTSLPANPSRLSLSTTAFTATGSYSDGTTADLTALAAWSSSNSAIATVSAGTTTALTQGTTAINATLNSVSGSSTLKVTGGNLVSMVVIPTAPRLVTGTLARISATGTFSNGTTRDITSVVDWTTASASLATVTTQTPRDSLAWLNAVAITAPSTTITATSGTITATTNLTVAAPTLSSITISQASLSQTAGTGDNLTVTASYSDASSQDVTLNTTWTTGDSSIATVADTGLAKGRVTGVANGTAIITAAFGGKTSTCSVTVTTRTLKSLAISGTPTLASGKQGAFTATATYSDNTTKDVTNRTTWEISSPSVAILVDSLNQPGQIVGVDSGSATLTATFGGISQTATLTVP